MLLRIISALIGAPIVLFFLSLGGYYLDFFILLLSLIGLFEFYKAMKNIEVAAISAIGFIAAIMYSFVNAFYSSIDLIGLILASVIVIAFAYEFIRLKHGLYGVIMTIFGVLYIPFLISHIVYIDKLIYGRALVWLPFLTAWYTDSFAYFVGSRFGKRKLCPNVSPKKTVEGAVAGLVGSSLLSILTGVVFNNLGYNIPLLHFGVIGVLCGAASELGDLAASYIKRHTKIKDFGNLIPGHGGILDRFDSILFTAPVVYYYFMIAQNMVK